jgi:hypothetical protein
MNPLGSAIGRNPLLSLPIQPAVEGLGADDWDVVEAAGFPRTTLRFPNDARRAAVPLVGDNSQPVSICSSRIAVVPTATASLPRSGYDLSLSITDSP